MQRTVFHDVVQSPPVLDTTSPSVVRETESSSLEGGSVAVAVVAVAAVDGDVGLVVPAEQHATPGFSAPTASAAQYHPGLDPRCFDPL